MIFRRRTLIKDVVIRLTFSIVIASVVAVGIIHYISTERSRTHVERKAGEYILFMKESLALPLWNFDSLGVQTISRVFFRNDFVAAVVVEDSEGFQIANLQKDSEYPVQTETNRVFYRDRYVGTVTLSLTPKFYIEKDRGFLFSSLVVVLVLLLVLVIMVNLILKDSLIKPMRYLMNATEQIGGGKYDWDPAKYEQLEIAEIIDKFGEMAAKVARREQALTETNWQLNTEILERRKTEKALLESENKFSIAFSSSPDIMMITTMADGVLVDANQAFFSVTGLEREEAIGHSFDLNKYGLDEEVIKKFDRKLREKGRAKNYELEIVIEEGKIKPFLISGRTAMIEKAECLIIVARDISRLKAALEGLKMYERIVSTSRELMAFVDTDFVYRALNDSYVTTYLKPKSRIIGSTVADLLGEDIFEEVIRGKLNQCLNGEVVQYERWLNTPAHGRRYMHISYYPYLDGEGTPLGVVVNTRDITTTKELESNLVQAKKLEAIGTLSTGVAHDFNNILQAISGNLQLLEKSSPVQPSRVTRYTEEIQIAVNRATDLVQSMLAFGRKVEPGLEPVEVREEILHSIRMLERTLPKMVEINTDFDGNLHPVEADANQLSLLLMNLGKNAGDAMPDGGEIFISASNVTLDNRFCANHPEASPGNYVRLVIRDNGCGMDSGTVKRIFDPFYTTKEIGHGTGLGLFIVYGIVKNHGGFLTCQSVISQGTMFSIYFPALDREAIRQYSEESAIPPGKNGNERILLVDDDQAIVEVAREFLVEFGYKVDGVSSGEEAIETLSRAKYQYDLIILDLGMPGMGGYRTLEEILRLNDGMKVLVASGYATEENRERLLNAGAAGFLPKPYRLEALTMRIREVIDLDNAA